MPAVTVSVNETQPEAEPVIVNGEAGDTNNVSNPVANVESAPAPNPPAPQAQPKKKRKRVRQKKQKPEGIGYGKYSCPGCKTTWASVKSFAEVSQECKTCKAQVFPIISPPGKTPYQGARRCFGEFKCSGCQKTWSSGNSWANMGQECRDCLINIYPHVQRKLLPKKGVVILNKRHLHEHCEKCKTIKRNCSMFMNKIM